MLFFEKIKKNYLLLFAIPAVLIYLVILLPDCRGRETFDEESIIDSSDVVTDEYGIEITALTEIKGKVKNNQTLSDILLPFNASHELISGMLSNSKGIFDARKIISGNNYTLYLTNDSLQSLNYFIYETGPIDYVVFEFTDSINVWQGSREVTTKERIISGKIESSLYRTLNNINVSDLLALRLSEVYAWQIDFYRIQKGDYFKVIFEEKYIGEKFVGIGRVIAAQFNHWGNDFYAFGYEIEDKREFFDENGKSLRKAFLQAPLKFSRISSSYSNRRFHPVLKTYRAHLGTDYAAPTGTPIMSVGDGVVLEAKYSSNNGNYVKVKHNSVYTTQYLHMSRFAKGIKQGVRVSQGEVIGYVGSTGLATGPHVCFRFWKNGVQVDHRKEKFPSAHPIAGEYLAEFQSRMVHIKNILDKTPVEIELQPLASEIKAESNRKL